MISTFGVAKKAVLARFDSELFVALDRVAKARKRKWGELLRLYAERALAVDIERLDRGESLDDLSDRDKPPKPPPPPRTRSGERAAFGSGTFKRGPRQ